VVDLQPFSCPALSVRSPAPAALNLCPGGPLESAHRARTLIPVETVKGSEPACSSGWRRRPWGSS
jgi:hypothetical protein